MEALLSLTPPVLRLAPLEAAAAAVAGATGLDESSARFAISLYLALPLAAVNGLLPAGAPRHAWCAATGLLLYMFAFGAQYAAFLATAAAVYAVLVGTAPLRALDGWRHWLAAVFAFGCLTLRHLSRMDVTANSVDDSVLHMMLTVKLYTLAYNLYDGRQDAARLAATAADPAASAGAKALAADRLARAVSRLPSPLEFLGYLLNPTSLLVGPAFEFREYATAQGRAGLPAGAPSRWPRVALCTLCAVVFMALHVVVAPRVPIAGVYEQAVAAGGPAAAPWWYRLGYLHAALFMVRVQYYFVWQVAEAAALTAGFGYRGDVKPAPDWLGTSNVDPLNVELSGHTSLLLKHWNIHTQSWLERYIFKRAPRSINRWATFAVSAFWHGTYPGYYLSFFTAPLHQEAWREFEAAAGHLLPQPGSGAAYTAYWAAGKLLMHLSMDYCLAPFCLLDVKRGLAVWASVGYVGHVLPVATLAVMYALKAAGLAGGKAAGAGGKDKRKSA